LFRKKGEEKEEMVEVLESMERELVAFEIQTPPQQRSTSNTTSIPRKNDQDRVSCWLCE
jgi:hypothetical protein